MKYLITLFALLALPLAAQTSTSALKDGSNITNPAFRNAVLPTQTSQSGKYLKTNGTAATWESVTADLTSGPVTSSAGVSAIADSALSIAKTSGLQTALDGKQSKATEKKFYPEDYGALGDGISYLGNVSITSGQATLTVSGASFAAGDVGKKIIVPGAGAAGATLVTSISARTSATVVTLAANASTTLTASAKTIHYSTDDTAACQAAIDAAAVDGGTVVLSKMYGLWQRTGGAAASTPHALDITKGWIKIQGITDGNSFPADGGQVIDTGKCGFQVNGPIIGIAISGVAYQAIHGLTFRDFTIQGHYGSSGDGYNVSNTTTYGILGDPSYVGNAKYPDCILIDRVNFQWLPNCLKLVACDSPTITNSRVCDSYNGVLLSGCIGPMISHNVIWDETGYGVKITGSTTSYNYAITGNAFGRSGRDVHIAGSGVHGTITGNSFQGGSPGPVAAQYSGIYFEQTNALAANTVTGNNFSSTGWGFDSVSTQGWRNAAIEVQSSSSALSANVGIHGNSFNFISSNLAAIKISGASGYPVRSVSINGNTFTPATKIPYSTDIYSLDTKIGSNVYGGQPSVLGTNTRNSVTSEQDFTSNRVILSGIPTYADNAAAATANAPIGSIYKTAAGALSVVVSTGSNVDSVDNVVTNYINKLTTYGVTVSGGQRTLLETFVNGEKAAGRWTAYKRIFIMGWANAQANALDLVTGKSGNFHGTMTHSTGWAQADGVTGFFDTGFNMYDGGLTNSSASFGVLLFAKRTTAYVNGVATSNGLGAVTGAVSTQAAELQLLELDATNMGWYPASGTSGLNKADGAGIWLCTADGTNSKSWFENTAQTATARGASSKTYTPAGNVERANQNLWRIGGVTSGTSGTSVAGNWFSNAKIGMAFFATSALVGSEQAVITAKKTLWEGLFSLTLP